MTNRDRFGLAKQARMLVSGSSPLRRWIRNEAVPVLLIFTISRALIFGMILFSRLVILRGKFWRPGGLLAMLVQWDGGWYLSIMRKGYYFSSQQESNMGFFPLYPLLAKQLNRLLHNPALSAVVTSNLCLLGAGLLLSEIIRKEYAETKLRRATVLFFMFSPVSFFFSSAYTESTFLMLTLAAFLAAMNGQWLIACLAGMAASATRQVGFLIAIPLFFEYVSQTIGAGRDWRALLHPRTLLFALVPCGFGLFMLYGYTKFHDPLAFVHATAIWKRNLASPVTTVLNVRQFTVFYEWLFLVSLGVAICLVAAGVWLKIRQSYLIYIGIMILVYVSSNSLEAIPRNLSVLFPLFLIVGLLAERIKWLYEPFFTASVTLLAVCTILFANGYWMT